jgi:NADPH2:quinone reductase
MKAIRVHAFGEPDVLKVEAIGVNPVDTYIRAGKYGPREFPFTPGSDVGGTIEAKGPGVIGFKIGDRVYTGRTASGAYAGKTVADVINVYPLAGNLTFNEGAALGVPYGTAYRAVYQRGKALAGETVLIHGASGSVGTAAVQMTRAIGCFVVGTAGSEKGKKLVIDQGANHVLDHHDPAHLKKAMELTDGKGFNLIIEFLANVNLGNDLPVLAKNGRVVVVGSRGEVEIDPRDTMSREADIRGLTLNAATPEELKTIHAGIRAGLELGALRPIVDKEMPLAQAAQAHVEVLQGESHGKIVLIP